MRRDSLICDVIRHCEETLLIPTYPCGMTRSCMRRDSLIRIYVCIYLCIYVKHDSRELMVWLAHAWDVTHSYVYMYVYTYAYMSNMTLANSWYDSLMHETWLTHTYICMYIYMHICQTWISRTHGMTRSCMRRDSLIRIYTCIYIYAYMS